MYFESLKLKEGMNESFDIFAPSSTLFYSSENSVGKTTFIRLLLHSLGYKVPSTYGINFDKIESKLVIRKGKSKLEIIRFNNLLKVRIDNSDEKTFSLPTEHMAFMFELFNNDNFSIISNILGMMYVDQEKGWTLLNRGVVIGVNRFSIDELIAGLGSTDCGDLIAKKRRIEFEISKYKAMENMQAIKNEMNEKNGFLAFDDEGEQLNRKVCQQRIFVNQIKSKISEIDSVIYENQKFIRFIENLRITVENPNNNEPIIVTEKNMTFANDNIEYVKSRKYLLLADLSREENILNKLIDEQKKYEMTHTEISKLFGEDDSEIILQKNINSIDFDPTNVEMLLNDYREKLSLVKKDIKQRLNSNEELINRIYMNVYRYAKSLGIENKIRNTSDFLFTDKLKDYSGAILHKLVMCFKIALHKEIEEFIGECFPFILDSPSGRELKREHANEIIKLIKKELPKTQILIASIQKYDVDKVIYFDNYAIETRK